ncbi:hypothetical protein LguiA_024517 [Lonicera macranthoides]
MEIEHFSHEHPLILGKEMHQQADGSGDDKIQKSQICAGCLEPIILSSSSYAGAYYSCAECKFFLHKLCAELPMEMNHPSHPRHMVKLSTDRSCKCQVCDCRWKNFTYSCSICNFDIDVICATLMERKIDHVSHKHSLFRQRKPGLFRFFAHVHCATSQLEPFVSILLPRRTSKVKAEQEQVEDSGIDMIHFPVVNQSVILISHILKEIIVTKNETANQCGSLPATIKHDRDPNHILSLKGNISKRCKACFKGWSKPILAYACNHCDFVIDSCCALLSKEVMHRYDEHPFILTYFPVKEHSVDYYCELCEKELNSKWWFYHCAHCDRSIHIKCLRPFYRWANIKYGRTLNIEGHHQHPLALSPVIEEDAKINNSLRVIIRGTDCDECGDRFYTSSGYFSSRDSFGFRCVHCNFKLCYDCAKSCYEDHHIYHELN